MEKFPAADLLIRLRESGSERPQTLPHTLSPATETDAYRVQFEVLGLLGARVAGWKSTMLDANRGMAAPVAIGNLLPGPAHVTELAHPTRGALLGIEPEIAFRMSRPLIALPYGQEHSRATVLAAIDSAHAALEICACRVGDFDSPLQLDKLADAISNEGLVLGAPVAGWRELDLAQLPLTLQINGSVAHQAVGGHPIGDPLAPVVWLANHLSTRGIGLQAGDVVTTGSCAGLHRLATGQHVRAEFGGLGSVTLQA